jgi:hypothetical protein
MTLSEECVNLQSQFRNKVKVLILRKQIFSWSNISVQNTIRWKSVKFTLDNISNFENSHARHSGKIIYSYMLVRRVCSIDSFLQLVIL